MTKAEQFFHDNAGFSYDPKTETPEQGKRNTARALARAEAYAKKAGWQFEVEPDPDADESWMDATCRNDHGGTAWQVALYDETRQYVLASLGGCYGDGDYERVVKAELALEAMTVETARGK